MFMIKFVQRKPLQAIAIQYDGTNAQEIADFLGFGNEDIITDKGINRIRFSYQGVPADELMINKGDYVVKDKFGWPQVYHEDTFYYLFNEDFEYPDRIGKWNSEWNEIPPYLI